LPNFELGLSQIVWNAGLYEIVSGTGMVMRPVDGGENSINHRK